MNPRLNTPWIALRFGIGLTATLAGLDKFFNLLADWGTYVSPLAAQVLPFSTDIQPCRVSSKTESIWVQVGETHLEVELFTISRPCAGCLAKRSPLI